MQWLKLKLLSLPQLDHIWCYFVMAMQLIPHSFLFVWVSLPRTTGKFKTFFQNPWEEPLNNILLPGAALLWEALFFERVLDDCLAQFSSKYVRAQRRAVPGCFGFTRAKGCCGGSSHGFWEKFNSRSLKSSANVRFVTPWRTVSKKRFSVVLRKRDDCPVLLAYTRHPNILQ